MGSRIAQEPPDPARNRGVVQPCKSCGYSPPAEHLFCGMCGTRLGRDEPAERRTLTVVFCDLVGSTDLSRRLDPEELRELIREYQRLTASSVERLDGYVAQYLGDGILIYFGYPVAHEDDARRAAHCSLEILQSVPEPLKVRLGLHTGQVVVGEMGGGWRRERLAIGDVPNLAARLQGLATPGTAVLSQATFDLVEPYFVCESQGNCRIKGVPERVPVYRVLRARAKRTARLTPFVARQDELRRLHEAWRQVQQGQTVQLTLLGEPGIGKSRLTQQFIQELPRVLMASCSPYAVSHPYFAIQEWIRDALDLPLSPPVGLVQGRVSEPLLALLCPEDGPALPSRALAKRAMHDFLAAWAADSPGVLVVDDAQWLDPSSREVLQELPSSRLLLLVLARPDTPGLGIEIHLGPLEPGAVDLMLQSAGVEPERWGVLRERCEGNPFFAEELARSASVGPLPNSLQSLLLARLDRLPDSRRLAQVASVIGRHFPLTVLRRLWQEEVDERLTELEEGGILECRGDDAGFRHGLLQEAAYHSLLQQERQLLHRRLGWLLQAEFPEYRAHRPEVLAFHFQQANLPEEASRYFEAAAMKALWRSASLEALAHLDQAMELVRGPEAELRLLGRRLAPLVLSRGYGSEEVALVSQRAMELAGRIKKPSFEALRGLWAYHHVRSLRDQADLLSRQLLDLARDGSPIWQMEALVVAGVGACQRARWDEARQFLVQATARKAGPTRELTGLFGHDSMVVGLGHLGLALVQLGHCDQVEPLLRRARQRGRSHPVNRIIAAILSGMCYQLLERPAAALSLASRACELCHLHGVRHWLGLAQGIHGWALAGQGEAERGLALVRQGLVNRRAVGASQSLPYLHWLEALVARMADRPGEAREAIETAGRLAREVHEVAFLDRIERF